MVFSSAFFRVPGTAPAPRRAGFVPTAVEHALPGLLSSPGFTPDDWVLRSPAGIRRYVTLSRLYIRRQGNQEAFQSRVVAGAGKNRERGASHATFPTPSVHGCPFARAAARHRRRAAG